MNTQQLAYIIKLKQDFLMSGKATIKSTVAEDMAGNEPDPRVKEVSQEFVIPSPKKHESKDDYISRCMGVIGGEDKPQDQLVAMCVATYENK